MRDPICILLPLLWYNVCYCTCISIDPQGGDGPVPPRHGYNRGGEGGLFPSVLRTGSTPGLPHQHEGHVRHMTNVTDKEGLALRHNRASKVKHQLIRKDGWILVNNVLHVIAIRQLYHSATWLSVDGPFYVVLYTLMDNKQQGFISFILICCSFEILL